MKVICRLHMQEMNKVSEGVDMTSSHHSTVKKSEWNGKFRGKTLVIYLL